MKNRIITAIWLVAIVVGFFLLREYVNPICFDILIALMAFFGTYEILMAFKKKITIFQAIIASVYSFCAIVLNGLDFDYFMPYIYSSLTLLLLLFAMLVLDYKHTTLEGTGLTLLAMAYPSTILISMIRINNMEQFGLVAMLLIFVISPLSDVFAFFVGITFKGKKLCPEISPNKTISGAIGGLIGGMVGALLVYFIFGQGIKVTALPIPTFVVFGFIGLIGGVLTEFGDLVESAMKRKLGLKDFGKVLPGHGGVLDRIDGFLFAGVAVYICFEILIRFL